MNDTITKIAALLFEDLEETDETVALHDEILQNCQERYADLTAGGMTADEATKAVIVAVRVGAMVLSVWERPTMLTRTYSSPSAST